VYWIIIVLIVIITTYYIIIIIMMHADLELGTIGMLGCIEAYISSR